MEKQINENEILHVHINNSNSLISFVEDLDSQGFSGIFKDYEDDPLGTMVNVNSKAKLYTTHPSSTIFEDSNNIIISTDRYFDMINNESHFYKLKDSLQIQVHQVTYDMGQDDNGRDTQYAAYHENITKPLNKGDYLETDKFGNLKGYHVASIANIDTAQLLAAEYHETAMKYFKLSGNDIEELLEQGSISASTKLDMENAIKEYDSAIKVGRDRYFEDIDFCQAEDIAKEIFVNMPDDSKFYVFKGAMYNDGLPGVIISSISKEPALHMVVRNSEGVHLERFELIPERKDICENWEAVKLTAEEAMDLIKLLPEDKEYINFYTTLDADIKNDILVRREMYKKIESIVKNSVPGSALRAEVYMDLLESIEQENELFQSEGAEHLPISFIRNNEGFEEYSKIEINMYDHDSLAEVKNEFLKFVKQGIEGNDLKDIKMSIQYKDTMVLEETTITADELKEAYVNSILNRSSFYDHVMEHIGLVSDNAIPEDNHVQEAQAIIA